MYPLAFRLLGAADASGLSCSEWNIYLPVFLLYILEANNWSGFTGSQIGENFVQDEMDPKL